MMIAKDLSPAMLMIGVGTSFERAVTLTTHDQIVGESQSFGQGVLKGENTECQKDYFLFNNII